MRAPQIVLLAEEQVQLERWVKSRTVEVRLAQRAEIVLLAAGGMLNKDIAKRLEINPNTVVRWRGRFFRERCIGIQKDRPRNNTSKARSVEWAQRIVAATTQAFSARRMCVSS